jgi:hypothetical protein
MQEAENKNTNFSTVLENTNLWESMPSSASHGPLGQGNPDFLFGVGTSMYQDSGKDHCPDSQWRHWEDRCRAEATQSGKSADLFSLYQNTPLEIIKRLKLLSINTGLATI